MTGDGGGPIRRAGFAELDAPTLYRILQLRVDVFVVEQHCAYRELDGRDLEPGARHLWIEADDGAVIAYLRTLDEADGVTRIGRVVTAPVARRAGLAGRLVDDALADATGPVVADAQQQLRAWYAARGFAVTGPAFTEDGIPHVPMRREPEVRA
jgi:ElaA protein